MTIQWFPGHMHRARKQIAQAMPNIDIVIEILDARLPRSSRNPLVEQLRLDKPCIKVLNKSDLADPAATQAWIEHLNAQKQTEALALTTHDRTKVLTLIERCHALLPSRAGAKRQIRTMIMGIPNVGKSTMINVLAGKTLTKTGNLPALTRHPQQIKLDKGVVLSDTPGILWPKIEHPIFGLRLAVSGAIRDTAFDLLDVGLFAAEYLAHHYPDALLSRYKLKVAPEDLALHEAETLLTEIGKRRGCLLKGGGLDLHKASEILLSELRQGTLGRITFETPAMIEAELRLCEEDAETDETYTAQRQDSGDENH
jgi:ribosome biogenesis GTPase A